MFALKISTSKAVGLFLMYQEVSDMFFITGVVCELTKVKLSSAFYIFLQVAVDLDFITGVS